MDCTSITCMTQVLVVTQSITASECCRVFLSGKSPTSIFQLTLDSDEILGSSTMLLKLHWVRTSTTRSLKCLGRVGAAGSATQSRAPETHWLAPGSFEVQEVRRKQAPG